MSRFNQWHKTDYLSLPVDYYMQAGLQKDQQIETELQNTTAALASYKSLQPIGANAQALHEQVLSNLKSEIQGIAKENLKSPDALMKLNSVINNPEYIKSLSGIARDTELYKAADTAYKEYVKKSGNNINASPFLEARMAMANEEGDATKFDPNRFMGLDAIPEYMEVQKEIDDVVSKMKQNGRIWDEPSGAYITTHSIEDLSPERIRTAVMHEFRGRRDIQEQLNRNIRWDAFSNNAPVSVQAKAHREDLAKQVSSIDTDLAIAKTDKAAFMKKYGIAKAEDINNVVNQLASHRQLLGNTAGMDDYNLVRNRYIDESVNASTAVYSNEKRSDRVKVNGIWLQDRQFAHAEKMEKKRHENNMKVQFGQTMLMPDNINVDGSVTVDENKIKDKTFIVDMLRNSGMNPHDLVQNGVLENDQPSTFVGQMLQGLTNVNMALVERSLGFGGGDGKDATNPKGVKKLAEIWGYNEHRTSLSPLQYLEQQYRANAHVGIVAANANIDGYAQARAIANAGKAVYVNGEMVTSDKKKQELLNKLTNMTGDSGGPRVSKSEMGLYGYRREDGIPVVSYNIDGQKVSFELSGGMAAGLENMKAGFKASANRNYGIGTDAVDPADVDVPRLNTNHGVIGYDSYTAARLNNGPGLTYFKDASTLPMQMTGHSAIASVTRALLEQVPPKERPADGTPKYMEYVNKAVRLINDHFKGAIKEGQNADEARTIKFGKYGSVTLPEPVYIINNKFRNYDEYLDSSRLRVGSFKRKIDPTSKAVYGGAENELDVHTWALTGATNNMTIQYKKPTSSVLQESYQAEYNNYANENDEN